MVILLNLEQGVALKHVHHSRLMTLVLGVSIATLAGCAGERVVEGDCQPVFDGEVCTWGTLAGNQVVAFGATVPLTSVESAPADMEMVFPPPATAVVALPAEVTSATGFNHLLVNWEAHGHPPGLFLTPHFDFHFYTIDHGRVDAIDCTNLIKPAQLPADYTLPDIEIPGLGMLEGLCVPKMGMHSMRRDELDQTDPFGASMIVGYYAENVIFVEPMIAQAKLMEGRSFPLAVPSVPKAGDHVRWPTRFEATYDSTSRSYRFIFSGMSSE